MKVQIIVDLTDPEMADPLFEVLKRLMSERSFTTEVVHTKTSPPQEAVQQETRRPRGRPAKSAGNGAGVAPVPATAQDAPSDPFEAADTEAVEDTVSDNPFESWTEQDQHEKSLELLRHVYARPAGGKQAVTALQKKYQVAMFKDVPLSDAPGLLVEAMALARQFNVVIRT